MKLEKTFTLVSALTLTLTLSACNEESDSQDDTQTCSPQAASTLETQASVSYSSEQIDASSHTEYTYYQFGTGTVTADAEWDIALKRYDIIINEDSEMALIADQAEFYDDCGEPVVETFVNATADGELEHLTDAVAADDEDYSVAEITYAISNNYTDEDAFIAYDYDFTTSTGSHGLVAADDNFWLVRSAEGTAYAKFRVTQIYDAETYPDYDVNGYDTAIFELQIASDSNSAFGSTVTWNVATDDAVGEGCYDIDGSAEVDCSSDDWDIKYDNELITVGTRATPNPTIRLRSGISGSGSAAALGPYDYANIEKIESAVQDVEEDAFDIAVENWNFAAMIDARGSVFSDSLWYAYDLQENHSFWPNYRVYHVRDDEAGAFIQVTNYYNDDGTSGFINLRYIVN